MVRAAAVVPILALLAAMLGGCEYSTDRYADDSDPDQSLAPAAASMPPTHADQERRVTPHNQQAYIDALSELLGPPGDEGFPYAAANSASWVADISAGEYVLTAACVAAPGAELTMQFGNALPEHTSFRCGMGKVIYLDHQGGPINARVVPPPESPYGYTGLRLDRAPAHRDPSAVVSATPRPSETGTNGSAGAIPSASADPEFEAELERNMGAVELMLADVPAGVGGAAGGVGGHSAAGGGLTYNGTLTNAGRYTITAACAGTGTAQLRVTSRGSMEGSQGINVPCGEPVSQQVELGAGHLTVHLVAPDESRSDKAAVGAVRIGDATR